MKIEIIKDSIRFKKIRSQWEELYSLGSYSIFQSFTYNYYAWQHIISNSKGSDLYIIIIYDGSEIIAIFPCYKDNFNIVRFINDHHSDFCDILSKDYFDINTLFKKLDCKRFSLIHLKKGSILYNLVSKIDKSIYRIKEGVRFSSIEIPEGSFPDNFIRYRSKQKSEIRRIKKKNRNFQHRSYSVKDMSFPKDKIIDLKDRIISSRLRTEDFLDNDLINLIEDMYNNSDLIISEVFELDSRSNINSLSISFILVRENDYQFWIDLFIDKTMINLYNYIKFIEFVSLDKNVSINFGRGDYRYKISNFQSDIAQLYSFNTYSTSIDLLFRYYILDRIRDIVRKIYYKIK